MPETLRHKKIKLKWGDIQVRTRGDLTAVWMNKRDIHMLTNIHNPSAECASCNERENTIKPHAVEEYNRHVGHVDKGNRIANSYSIGDYIWEWMKKLLFHLLDICYISDTEFHLALVRMVRNTEAHAGQQPHLQKPLARPGNVSKVTRLDSSSNKHWPVPFNQMCCCIRSAPRVMNEVSVKCHIYMVGLHVNRTVS